MLLRVGVIQKRKPKPVKKSIVGKLFKRKQKRVDDAEDVSASGLDWNVLDAAAETLRGALYKRGAKNKGWRKRYCELVRGELMYVWAAHELAKRQVFIHTLAAVATTTPTATRHRGGQRRRGAFD